MAVVACFSGVAATATVASAATSHRLVKITYLTDFIQNGVYSPIWYGIQHGYYKKEGIDLKLVYGTGSSTTVQDVANGQAQIGDAFSGVIAQAVAKKAHLKAVGFFRANGAFAFFCDKSLGIDHFSQLAGKSVIIPPGTVQAALYPGVLKAAGLKPDSIKVDAVAPASAGATYASGQADCISETLGDAPTFAKRRPSTTLLWSKGGFTVPGFAFFTKDSFLAAHRAIVGRFLKATYKSIAAALAHPAAAVKAFDRANPTASPSLTAAQWKASQTVFCTTSMGQKRRVIGYQSLFAWSKVSSEMHWYEGMPEIKAKSLYTNAFFKKDHVSSRACVPKLSS